MTDKCLTVVCCYNDEKQFKQLEYSIQKQNMACDILGIDNRGQCFTSCSKALNSALNQIQTEYVVFAHQDIELPDGNMLQRFVDYMKQTQTYDILGVAGISEETVLSMVRHGAALVVAGEEEFTGLVACDTVDECFFGGHTEGFRKYPFDETLCDNWHMYAVERCLNAAVCGNKVYVCDISLLHHSGGQISHAYNRNFRQIAKQYSGKLDWIRTVCGSARTDLYHRTLFYLKREILIRLHRYDV